MSDNEKNTSVENADADVVKADSKADVKKAVKKPKVPLKQRIAQTWREYKSEMKKIVWYNREQTFKSSVIVVVSIVVVAICIGCLDWGFSKLLMWLGTLV